MKSLVGSEAGHAKMYALSFIRFDVLVRWRLVENLD